MLADVVKHVGGDHVKVSSLVGPNGDPHEFEPSPADAKTLKPLWSFDTGGGVSAPPMAFSVNGKEYIALLVGQGGAWDKWFIDSTPDLKRIQPSSTLYVFGL